jgi:GH24 family phage-related lysozyme (muramidase)
MDRNQVIARLEQFEGRIPYMYLCTGGEVTVGIGHAIACAADAVQLPWAAGANNAQDGWAAVKAATLGLVALGYAGLTTCRLSDDAIDQLAADDIQRFTSLLEANFPQWNSYPEPVQEALFDMGYNLGIVGLNKFHMMLAAVNAGDWQTAAQQCHRIGISDTRNQATAALFLQAAGLSGPGSD